MGVLNARRGRNTNACWLDLSFVDDSSDLWRLLERPIEERRSWNRCLLIDPTPQLKAALLKNHHLDVLFTRCTAWTRIYLPMHPALFVFRHVFRKSDRLYSFFLSGRQWTPRRRS